MLNGRLSEAAKRLIVIFTVVEAIVFTVWLEALGIDAVNLVDFIPKNDVLAFVILVAGLFIEHRIAAVSNKV